MNEPLRPSDFLNRKKLERYLQDEADGERLQVSRPSEPTKRFFSAYELGLMSFPDLKQVVPGILVEGLTILAGPPKLGKSYAAMDMAIAVATGGTAFGSIRCKQGDVLYLALEDGKRRIQARLRQMLPLEPDLPDRLTFATDVPMIGDGLEAVIEAWVESVPEPTLIVIDTWRCVKPEPTGKGSAYDEDARAIEPLHAMTKRLPGLAISLIHHTRKMEADDAFATISGTYGLTGVADTLMVLARHGEGHKLCVRGRDIEDAEKALQRDRHTGAWRMTGDAREIAKTSERQELLDELREAGKPLSPTQLAAATGKKRDNIQHLLKRLLGEGKVKKEGYGKWTLSDPCHSVHSAHSSDAHGWSDEPDSERSE